MVSHIIDQRGGSLHALISALRTRHTTETALNPQPSTAGQHPYVDALGCISPPIAVARASSTSSSPVSKRTGAAF